MENGQRSSWTILDQQNNLFSQPGAWTLCWFSFHRNTDHSVWTGRCVFERGGIYCGPWGESQQPHLTGGSGATAPGWWGPASRPPELRSAAQRSRWPPRVRGAPQHQGPAAGRQGALRSRPCGSVEPPALGPVVCKSAGLSVPPTPFLRSAWGLDRVRTGHLQGPGSERGTASNLHSDTQLVTLGDERWAPNNGPGCSATGIITWRDCYVIDHIKVITPRALGHPYAGTWAQDMGQVDCESDHAQSIIEFFA